MDESGEEGIDNGGLNVKGCGDKKLRIPAERWDRELLCLQDLDDPIDNRRDGLVVKMAGAIKNQVDTGRKKPVWPDIARLMECSLCKVKFGNTNGVAIPDLLACDLAKNDIVSAGCRDDKSRPPLHR